MLSQFARLQLHSSIHYLSGVTGDLKTNTCVFWYESRCWRGRLYGCECPHGAPHATVSVFSDNKTLRKSVKRDSRDVV